MPMRGMNNSRPNQLRDDQETLYVSNVSYNLSAEDVKTVFAPYGVVHNVYVPKDRVTGRSKGIAFVTIDKSEVNSVLQEMSGKEIGGRNINCQVAKKRSNYDQSRQSQEQDKEDE